VSKVEIDGGWFPCGNELEDALIALPSDFPCGHLRVLMAVRRLTDGWGKAADRIAASQLATRTGLRRETVARIIADLERWKMLAVEHRGAGRPALIALQKTVSRWKIGATSEAERSRRRKQPVRSTAQVIPDPNLCVPPHTPVRSNAQEPVRSTAHTKDRKDIPSKTRNQSGAGASQADRTGPDPDRITRADLDSDQRCDQLLEQARKAGWGVRAEGERSRWYGPPGRLEWFQMRAYVLRKEDEFDDVCAVFAECARTGLYRGNGADEYEARAVVAMLDLSKPIDPRVDALRDALAGKLDANQVRH
jgi:phage replication O-like protein O